MQPRLASEVLVKALIRAAEVEGGFGAVLAKGDVLAGAVAVILAERGVKRMLLERTLAPSGEYLWSDRGGAQRSEAEFTHLIARRRRVDPDLWVVELDIACAERFADEMTAFG
jgi:hypothetical protein